eukprot:GHVP01056348.1.p1 GENE.GHVP01056348.1~~GHVP01056348.1.p1  ORF type:complete len:197 (+),score=23.92 GHVP01056348.1:1097-1687(+)
MHSKDRRQLCRILKYTENFCLTQPALWKISNEIVIDWEQSPKDKTKKLSLYIGNIMTRLHECSKGSFFVILSAFIYIKRLRNRYDKFKGEDGCSYRLFISGVILASKQWTTTPIDLKRKNTKWNDIVKLFNDDEILRMEMELVHFLDGELDISYNEFISTAEHYFLETEEGIVPGNIENLRTISSIEGNTNEHFFH